MIDLQAIIVAALFAGSLVGLAWLGAAWIAMASGLAPDDFDRDEREDGR